MKATQSFFRTLLVLLVLLAAGQPAWASVTGTGTENDPYVVDNWADLKAKMAAGGYIRLGADVTDPDGKGDSYLEVPAGVSVTLDLNGKALQRTVPAGGDGYETGYVIKVTTSNSTLTITDSSTGGAGTISGGKAFQGGAFYVEAGSTLIINGGVIANSEANDGSAIYNLGTLTINGGTIQNCTATRERGQGTIYNNGTLTINGGVIQNNTALYGGAIYNSNGWTTTINGGTIQNNSAIHTNYDEDGKGGGIVNYGTLYLYGGTIQGNSCARQGGGIYNNSYMGVKGTPVVIGNTKESENNNVYLPYAKVITLVGNITEAARIGVSPETFDNKITKGLPGKGTKANFVLDNSDGFELIINGQGELSTAVAYTITVPENVTVTGLTPKAANTYQEVSGNVVTLSATGYHITSATYNDGSDHVIDPVQGVFSFTMPSHHVTVSAVLEANKWSALQTQLSNASINADSPTLITLTEDIVASYGDSYLSIPAGRHAILDLNGHTIDRNMTESQVGGYVILLNGKSNNHASLTIRDSSNPSTGRITGGFDGNSGGNSAAGGINVQYGDLTLESGSICGNQCTFGGGGGVRLAGGTFTMTGGSITGNGVNTLENGAASAGGAIYGVSGDIYLRGGSITGNLCHGSSSYACSGIAHNYASGAAQLHLSGTFTLSDYLHGNREFIYLDGPINPTEPIAIDLYSGYNTQLTKNWSTHMGTAGTEGYFTLVANSESAGKVLGVIDDNLYIGTPEALYWHADANHDGSSWAKAYSITTTEGLDLLAKRVNGTDGYTPNTFDNKYFRLDADIAYTHKAANEAGADTENNFTAIGNSDHFFKGDFDGAGHSISGIRIYQPDCDFQGLFGFTYGTIKNVIISEAVIIGKEYVGVIAGVSHSKSDVSATISGCFVEGTKVGGSHAGAVVGMGGLYQINDCILKNNYYYRCTCGNNSNGIGTGEGSDDDDARVVYTITTTDPNIGVTAKTKACTFLGVNYYRSPTPVWLNTPGYTIVSASYKDDSGDHQINPQAPSFVLEDSDVIVSASLIVNATQDITAYAGTVSGVTRYWATFYNRTLNYRLPAGAQAFTMDADHHLCRVGTDGSIIPKNTPVVIIAEENALTGVSAASGTLTLTHTDSTAEINGTNILLGDENPVTVTNRKVDGKTPYVLGIAHGVFGFHPFIASPIPAQKAYYLSAE